MSIFYFKHCPNNPLNFPYLFICQLLIYYILIWCFKMFKKFLCLNGAIYGAIFSVKRGMQNINITKKSLQHRVVFILNPFVIHWLLLKMKKDNLDSTIVSKKISKIRWCRESYAEADSFITGSWCETVSYSILMITLILITLIYFRKIV